MPAHLPVLKMATATKAVWKIVFALMAGVFHTNLSVSCAKVQKISELGKLIQNGWSKHGLSYNESPINHLLITYSLPEICTTGMRGVFETRKQAYHDFVDINPLIFANIKINTYLCRRNLRVIGTSKNICE